MFNTKSSDEKVLLDFPIVKKASAPDTMLLIPHGKSARFRCRDLHINTVRSAASRLNKTAGYEEFIVVPYNNGETFDIVRK